MFEPRVRASPAGPGPARRERVAALAPYRILDTPPEDVFDHLVRLAARRCAAPVAALVFVGAERLWCKAAHGRKASDIRLSPAQEALLLDAQGPVTLADAETTDLPAFAAAPLVGPKGLVLGGLAVLDRSARTWEAESLEDLEVLARTVMDRLDARRRIDGPGRGEAMTRLIAETEGWDRAELMEAVIEQTCEAVMVVDAAGRRMIRNSAAVRLLGISSPDGGPRDWATRFGFYLPDEVMPVPPHEDPLNLALAGKPSHEALFFLRNVAHPGGRWVTVSAVPLRASGGETRGGIFTFRDVTEQHRAERMLREDEARFRALAQSAFEGLLISAEGRIVEVNEAFTRMTGYVPSDLAGLGPEALVHPDYLDLVRKQVLAGSPDAYEVQLVRKDGSVFPAEVRGRTIHYRGFPTRVTAVRDIGPRKEAENAIRAGLQRALVQQEALSRLTRILPSERESAFREILRVASRTLGVERASLWLFTDDRSAIRCVGLHEASSGEESAGAVLARSENPPYFRALEESDVVAADDAVLDPRTAGFAENYLRPYGIQSMLDAPVVEEGVLRGVLCLEHVGSPRRWRQDERTFALASAGLAARALGEARLRESEGRLQHFLENAHDFVIIVMPDGRYEYMNRAARRALGWSLDEVRRLTWEQVVVPEQVEGLRPAWTRVLSGEDVGPLAMTIRARDGRRIEVEGRVDCLRVGGVPVVVRGIYRDVTQERTIEEALRRSEDQVVRLEEQAGARTSFERLVGKSAPMRELFERLRLAARSDVTVLLTGESGTGKELAAGAIHALGPRKDSRFLAVNCSAIPDALLESELFGHAKGAFTGAVRDKTGLFQAADGGTLFLDEVGDMSPALQVKVLRALQEREIRRVGDERPVKVDVRIIAATNRDLPVLVAEGKIREDFYYRIRVFEIRLPPLRARREDVPLLLDRFMREFAQAGGRPVPGVEPAALRALMEHDWPGNVRELRNAVEHAFVTLQGDRLRLADLPPEVRGESSGAATPGRAAARTPGGPAEGRERDRIVEALRQVGGSRSKAARLLGISRVTLWNRMGRYGIR
ncbi:MAG TPA: sigma 54-interacting transcriptional regulator [Planctomycetota bacterium]|nr:sigma 54-interacting transcriptional regulator [Planctomycetota bacterium]